MMRNALFLAGLCTLAVAENVASSNFVVGEGYIKFGIVNQDLPKPSTLGTRQLPSDVTKQELGTLYTVQLGLGTPAQPVVVILDTGSFELWVNPNCANSGQPAFCNSFPRFTPSLSTSYVDTKSSFTLTYGKGSAAVEYSTDVVSIGTSKLKSQIFGVATTSSQIPLGILGIGPFISGYPDHPHFIDNLKTEGLTNSRAFSLDLRSSDEPSGSIVFGGLDTGKYTGALAKLPIIQAAAAPDGTPRYWVSLSSISIGTTALTTGAIAVFLDSGTTLTVLPTAVYNKLTANFPLAAADPANPGFYKVDCSVGNQAGGVDFAFGSKVIQVPWKDIIWHLDTNYCVIGAQPTSSGVYVLGDSFLRAAYAVFDLDNQNIHIAQATNCGTNYVAVGSGANAVPSVTGLCGAAVTSSSTSSSSRTTTTSSSSTSSGSSSTTTSSSSRTTSGSSISSSTSLSTSSTTRSGSVSVTTSGTSTSGSSSLSSSISRSGSTTGSSTGSPSRSSSSTLTSVSSSITTRPTVSSSSSKPTTLTSTVKITSTYTITSCAKTVTNCPVGSLTTEVITSYTTWCPGETTPTPPSLSTGVITIYSTTVRTITSCAPTVTNCPAGSTYVVTQSFPVTTKTTTQVNTVVVATPPVSIVTGQGAPSIPTTVKSITTAPDSRTATPTVSAPKTIATAGVGKTVASGGAYLAAVVAIALL